ncbi:hypothetical protein TRFO_06064 [Tritrichomonas foetus]|uniref:Uncharacterized protein n=1 Tax=Tritrichomonas foetus TaxID=1144522 RepID=A0A1J4K6J6_9EUKA|nr:hypothetical protein TRFO_06064 [Tritrichomonas foetus]|eukprot:OHT05069.1 hypothetical protein TRFO_06064 [Tritrichomonas foetus]
MFQTPKKHSIREKIDTVKSNIPKLSTPVSHAPIEEYSLSLERSPRRRISFLSGENTPVKKDPNIRFPDFPIDRVNNSQNNNNVFITNDPNIRNIRDESDDLFPPFEIDDFDINIKEGRLSDRNFVSFKERDKILTIPKSPDRNRRKTRRMTSPNINFAKNKFMNVKDNTKKIFTYDLNDPFDCFLSQSTLIEMPNVKIEVRQPANVLREQRSPRRKRRKSVTTDSLSTRPVATPHQLKLNRAMFGKNYTINLDKVDFMDCIIENEI